jgi:integrase
MINFKAAIRETEKTENKCNVKIRISHVRKTRYIPTKINILYSQFDKAAGKIIKHPNAKFLNVELQKIILDYEKKILSISEEISIKNLLTFLKNDEIISLDFFNLSERKIKSMKETGRDRPAKNYEYTNNILRKYRGPGSLNFKDINYKFLSSFETWMRTKRIENKIEIAPLNTNTISIHMRNIRAVFNQAINENIITLDVYPFRKYKIKSEKTAKRNLTIEQITTIKQAILTDKMAYARDMFMLSFYLIGMNFIDLFNLEPTNAERIVYKRAKTGKIYNIKLQPAAIEIINRYPGKEKLLNCCEIYSDSYNFMKYTMKFINRIEGFEHITSYYARHSWATIASKLGVDKDTISHALGHGNDTVTDIYIDFDLSKVDKANEIVCKAL